MLNKILLITVGFLAIVAVVLLWWVNYQSDRINSLQTAKNALESNNQLLISKMKRAYDDKIELGKRYEELESAAKADTAFDWGANIASSDVIIKLRENAVRLQGNRARAD